MRPTAYGVIKVLFILTVFAAATGALLMVGSGVSPIYVLISFTTLEGPPTQSAVLALAGAFFLSLSGMLMISLLVSYVLTLKTTEDLYRKLEGLESQVRITTLDSLEEVRRSLEGSVAEVRRQLDNRIVEGVKTVNQALEGSVKELLKVMEEAVVTFDQLLKIRVEELKKLLEERVVSYADRAQ